MESDCNYHQNKNYMEYMPITYCIQVAILGIEEALVLPPPTPFYKT